MLCRRQSLTTTFGVGRLKIAKGKLFFLPFALPRTNSYTLLVLADRSHEQPEEHVTDLEII